MRSLRRMVRPSVAVYAALAALAALAACGGSDPKQQREKIDSAAATTALTSEALRARHVSRRYARVMLGLLRDETMKYASDPKATGAVRARADSVRRQIERALAAADASADAR